MFTVTVEFVADSVSTDALLVIYVVDPMDAAVSEGGEVSAIDEAVTAIRVRKHSVAEAIEFVFDRAFRGLDGITASRP